MTHFYFRDNLTGKTHDIECYLTRQAFMIIKSILKHSNFTWINKHTRGA